MAGAIPAWFIPVGTAGPFLGDYAGEGVTRLGIDLQFFASGTNVPRQALTLHLESAFGTNQTSQVVEAYYVGPDTRTRRSGWFTYDYPVPSAATTIPAGWVVVRRDGQQATNADWVRLMHDCRDARICSG